MGRVFGILFLFKVLYFLLLTTVLQLWPVEHASNMFAGARQEITGDGHLTFASHFGSWDAEHYLFLSENGYGPGVVQNAFYPLWPLAIRGFSVLTGGNHVVAGMILANVFSLAAFTIFFGIVRDRFGNGVAIKSLVLLIVFPGAIFFQFIYSESLFLFLLVLLWFGLEKRHYGVALTAAIFLPMTRAIGLFVVIPIAWHLVVECYAYLREKHPDSATGLRLLSPASIWKCRFVWTGAKGALLLAPLYGWGIYLLFMLLVTGNAFGGFEAQKEWGFHSIGNLFDIPKFVTGFFHPQEGDSFWIFVTDRVAFYLLVLSLPVLWIRDKNLFWWTLAIGVVPAVSGTFWSYTRFAAVVFPIFVALSLYINQFRTRLVFPVVTVLFAGVNLMFLWRFLTYRWAG